MKAKKENIDIIFTETQSIFKTESFMIVSKLINCPYPDYRQVMPKETNHNITTDKLSLIMANKSLSACTNKITNQIVFDCYQKAIKLSVNDIDTGKNGKHEIESNMKGERIKLAYNCKFIDLILNYIKGDTVKIDIVSPTSATVINEDLSTFLIMPLRLNE